LNFSPLLFEGSKDSYDKSLGFIDSFIDIDRKSLGGELNIQKRDFWVKEFLGFLAQS
jgi:hypothetical protein